MKSIRIFVCVTILALVALSSLSAQSQVKFEQPLLITSAGQSADVTLAGMLFKKINITAKTAPRATASDIEGIKTLVIVPGFSSKGLGAAGISREQEMARVKEVIAAAQKKNIAILMLHIGGKPRRGQQSDDFNRIAGESSKLMIVVRQGDEDGFFSKLASDNKKPIEVVDKIADVVRPLSAAFQ